MHTHTHTHTRALTEHRQWRQLWPPLFTHSIPKGDVFNSFIIEGSRRVKFNASKKKKKKSGYTEGSATHSPTHTPTHAHILTQKHTHHAASRARAELLPAELGILGKYTKISPIVLFVFQQRRGEKKDEKMRWWK